MIRMAETMQNYPVLSNIFKDLGIRLQATKATELKNLEKKVVK